MLGLSLSCPCLPTPSLPSPPTPISSHIPHSSHPELFTTPQCHQVLLHLGLCTPTLPSFCLLPALPAPSHLLFIHEVPTKTLPPPGSLSWHSPKLNWVLLLCCLSTLPFAHLGCHQFMLLTACLSLGLLNKTRSSQNSQIQYKQGKACVFTAVLWELHPINIFWMSEWMNKWIVSHLLFVAFLYFLRITTDPQWWH